MTSAQTTGAAGPRPQQAGIAGRRIALIFGSSGIGGAERQGLVLARGLRDRHGCLVTVCFPGAPGPVADLCAQAGLAWVAAPTRPESRFGVVSAVKARIAARQVLRQVAAEACIGLTSPGNLVAAAAGRMAAVPVIWGQRDEGLAAFPAWLERQGLARCAAAVANGPGAQARLRELGVRAERLHLIANGIAIPDAGGDAAADAWRGKLGLSATDQVVVMVANLTRNKDHATVLRAWAAVEQRRTGAHLLFAGKDGDGAAAVRALVATLGLARVHCLGAVADVPGLCRHCDLAVFSSRSEGLPNGVLEPMAAGLAVVASDIPGCRAALGNGPFFAPGDGAGLADLVTGLLNDDHRRVALGAANRARIAAEFSPEAFIDRHAGILASLLR